MDTCCVCGRALPNRYAVAGRCEEPGCDAAFCAMHWHLGGRRCPAHGGPREYGGRKTAAAEPVSARGLDVASTEAETKGTETMEGGKDGELLERAKTELTPQARKSILRSVADMAAKIGRGAGSLVERLRGVRSPEAVIGELDAQLAANRERRVPLSKRHEELYAQIAAKRKQYMAAPAARKRLMELELKGLMAEYKGLEREIAVLLENERVAATVRGRTMELIALGLRKIGEDQIDRLTDDIEEATAEAEDVSGALDDLEKAGARRDREGATEAFEAELAGFADEPEAADSSADWLGDTAMPDAGAEAPVRKAEEEAP